MIIYEGPSQLDGQPIVAIVTGFDSAGNKKTGWMLQTWILRADVSPLEAVASDKDVSICGDCKHRGSKDGKGRSCYVALHTAPMSIWRTYKAGGYPRVWLPAAKEAARNRLVRIGSYGDPAAVPVAIWEWLVDAAHGLTGYTHAWRSAPTLRPFVMASVDSETERAEAQALGWRTFRVKEASAPVLPGEIVCPASAEGGYTRTCSTCLACNGSRGPEDRRASVVITVHGGSGKPEAFTRNVAR